MTYVPELVNGATLCEHTVSSTAPADSRGNYRFANALDGYKVSTPTLFLPPPPSPPPSLSRSLARSLARALSLPPSLPPSPPLSQSLNLDPITNTLHPKAYSLIPKLEKNTRRP